MSTSYYKAGDWNVICDRTGFKMKRSECRKEWNGLLVRKQSWFRRHPQDIPPHVPKTSIPRDPRVQGEFKFVTTNQVTVDDL